MTTYKDKIHLTFYRYGSTCARLAVATRSQEIKREDFALLLQGKKDLEIEMDKLLSGIEDN